MIVGAGKKQAKLSSTNMWMDTMLLLVAFGIFGVHRFYHKKYVTGALMALVGFLAAFAPLSVLVLPRKMALLLSTNARVILVVALLPVVVDGVFLLLERFTDGADFDISREPGDLWRFFGGAVMGLLVFVGCFAFFGWSRPWKMTLAAFYTSGGLLMHPIMYLWVAGSMVVGICTTHTWSCRSVGRLSLVVLGSLVLLVWLAGFVGGWLGVSEALKAIHGASIDQQAKLLSSYTSTALRAPIFASVATLCLMLFWGFSLACISLLQTKRSLLRVGLGVVFALGCVVYVWLALQGVALFIRVGTLLCLLSLAFGLGAPQHPSKGGGESFSGLAFSLLLSVCCAGVALVVSSSQIILGVYSKALDTNIVYKGGALSPVLAQLLSTKQALVFWSWLFAVVGVVFVGVFLFLFLRPLARELRTHRLAGACLLALVLLLVGGQYVLESRIKGAFEGVLAPTLKVALRSSETLMKAPWSSGFKGRFLKPSTMLSLEQLYPLMTEAAALAKGPFSHELLVSNKRIKLGLSRVKLTKALFLPSALGLREKVSKLLQDAANEHKRLARYTKERVFRGELVVEAAPDASYGTLEAVLLRCRQAGFQRPKLLLVSSAFVRFKGETKVFVRRRRLWELKSHMASQKASREANLVLSIKVGGWKLIHLAHQTRSAKHPKGTKNDAQGQKQELVGHGSLADWERLSKVLSMFLKRHPKQVGHVLIDMGKAQAIVHLFNSIDALQAASTSTSSHKRIKWFLPFGGPSAGSGRAMD